jgi:hypothetical protein
MTVAQYVTLRALIDLFPDAFNERYLRRLVAERRIPHYKPSDGRLMFNVAEVEDWIRAGRVDAVR